MKPGDLVLSRENNAHGIVLKVAKSKIFGMIPGSKPDNLQWDRIVEVLFVGSPQPRWTTQSLLVKANS